MISLVYLARLGSAALNLCVASHNNIKALDFHDPSIILDPKTSHCFAFATHDNGKNVQADGKWLPLPDVDILPIPGMWTNSSHPDIRAPDVRYIQQTDTMSCITWRYIQIVRTTALASLQPPGLPVRTLRSTSLSRVLSRMAAPSALPASTTKSSDLDG
jgi:hypothetical protein